MNLKSILLGAAIGVVVVTGGVCIYAKNVKKEKESNEDNIVYAQMEEKATVCENKKGMLEILSYEKKYQEEFKTENYEVIVKNTSGEKLDKITFTLGEGIYELYNMSPDEKYKFVAYNTEKDLNLKVMSVDFEIKNYYPEEISLNLDSKDNKFKGSITNNGQRDLYPGRIVYFLKDKDGYTIQKSIEYAGCFFEGLVISPSKSHEFESEIPEELTLDSNKNIIVEYTDLEFKNTDVRFF